MLRKPARLIADCFGASPAEILFGDGPLLYDLPSCSTLPHATENSSAWLARAEAALRETQLSECQRCVAQALRLVGEEGRALHAEEWMFLAGVSLLNGDSESATHQIRMARRAVRHQKAVDPWSGLQVRILILQTLITGVSSPDAGNAELLDVFRYLARHRCPSLCRHALVARRLLQEWGEPGTSVAWWNSLNAGMEPDHDRPKSHGTSRPEWN